MTSSKKRMSALLVSFLVLLLSEAAAVGAGVAAEGDKGLVKRGRARGRMLRGTTAESGTTATATIGDEEFVLRWASTGGGWRAQAAAAGFANLFHQAGLLGEQKTKKDDALSIGAFSSNSGSSWFSTQFFYSPSFHAKVLGTPSELHDFIADWMKSYGAMQSGFPSSPLCLTGSGADLGNLLLTMFSGAATQPSSSTSSSETAEELCNILVGVKGEWANFVQEMIQSASTSAYNDPDLVHRAVIPENKIESLANVDLFVATSLAPNSRRSISSGNNNSPAMIGYLRSGWDTAQVYSVPIAGHYAVNGTDTFFNWALHDEVGPMNVVSSYEPSGSFSMSDYEEFYLLSGNATADGHVKTVVPGLNASRAVLLNEPFGGGPVTVAQIASASSAALGSDTGSVPSIFAQAGSTFLNQITDLNGLSANRTAEMESGIEELLDELYSMSLLDGLAVCAQWPGDCSADGDNARLIDGVFSDGATLALNIGEYQMSEDGGDPSITVKVLLTDMNQIKDSNVKILSYFNTTFNQNIEPGDFVWAPSEQVPWRSPQIFDNYLDNAMIQQATVSVPGTSLTYTPITATTISNRAFGVSAGQKVEILLLKINSDIPTTIVGASTTEAYTGPLADLAETIAGSRELQSIVREFVHHPKA